MENFDRIQKYLFNEMTEAESSKFEQEVMENEVLATELELQRFEMETIDQLEEDALRMKAKNLKAASKDSEDNTDNVVPIRKNLFKRFAALSIAASLLLLLGYFALMPKDISSEELLAMSYNEARLDFGNRLIKSTSETESIFNAKYTEVLKTQNTDQAQEAMSYFKAFSASNEQENIQAKLNIAHAYMLAKQYEEAIVLFNQVELDENSTVNKKEESSLFKATALIAIDKNGEAISILQKLARQGQYYDVLAEKILAELG